MIDTYAGDRYEVTASATFDAEPLGLSDVASVRFTAYRDGGAVAQAETPMTWDAADERWVYLWDTPAIADDYWAKVTVVGLDGSRASEYRRIRLRPNPAL